MATTAPITETSRLPAFPGHAPTVEYGWRRWLLVLGIMFAPLMETIDSAIVNIALPAIQGNLGATLEEAAWIVTGYLIANVVVIPLTPWLQTRFGRRQYFVATTIGFTIASLLCRFSTSILQLIVMRMLQGLFGGGLIATAQSAMRDVFPEEEVTTSQGAFAIVIIVGPVIAPMLGGVIVENLSWQWIFFVNLVPGAISAIIVSMMMRNPEEPRPLPVDVVGIALLVLGVGSLQYLLDEGERQDWFSSPFILGAAALAVLGLTAFVLWELYGTSDPIVDLHVIGKYRSVAGAIVLAMGISATMFGTVLVLPQYVQNILNFTAFDSGVLQLFRALPIIFMTPVVGMTVGSGKLDSRIMMAVGWTFTGISSLWLASRMTGLSAFGDLMPPLVLGGMGSAMLFIPLMITMQTTTEAVDSSKVGSLVTLAFQLGGSITGAAIVTFLDRRAAFHLNTLAGSITRAHPVVREALQRFGVGNLYGAVMREAQILAFVDSALIVGALALLLIPLVGLLKRQPHVIGQISIEM